MFSKIIIFMIHIGDDIKYSIYKIYINECNIWFIEVTLTTLMCKYKF